MSPVSPINSIVHQVVRKDELYPYFLFSNKFGVYEFSIEEDKIRQNLLEDTVRELEVKIMQPHDEKSFLIFPKWDKFIKKMQFHISSKFEQGLVTLRDVEWTKGTIPMKGFNTNEHDWHMGHSGKTIFLSDFEQERSYVLTDGHDFNYWCDLQSV